VSGQFNYKLFLWAIGVLQPVRTIEVSSYLNGLLGSRDAMPDSETLNTIISTFVQHGFIKCVSKKHSMYILTPSGGELIGAELRKLRDRTRIFLLDGARRRMLGSLGSINKKMSGDSPLELARLDTQDAPWPKASLTAGPLPLSQRCFWPRVTEQLEHRVGSLKGEPSTSLEKEKPILSLNYYSLSKVELEKFDGSSVKFIAQAIGVSPQLVSYLMKNKDENYRSFNLKKSNGKLREIRAPRKFLKVLMYWLSDYFLSRLRVHSKVYSYKRGVSIKDNAMNHVGKKYVLNIDIENYFGSISDDMIYECLVRNRIDPRLARTISDLCTLDNVLPQGAPSSPAISNSVLYPFDRKISMLCDLWKLDFSRYSDDITISGNDKSRMDDIRFIIIDQLNLLGFSVNKRKCRMVSNQSRQVVTGLLVNDEVRPTRKYRRLVRALFNNADRGNSIPISVLLGHYNYLKSFQGLETEVTLLKYNDVINKIKLSSEF